MCRLARKRRVRTHPRHLPVRCALPPRRRTLSQSRRSIGPRTRGFFLSFPHPYTMCRCLRSHVISQRFPRALQSRSRACSVAVAVLHEYTLQPSHIHIVLSRPDDKTLLATPSPPSTGSIHGVPLLPFSLFLLRPSRLDNFPRNSIGIAIPAFVI
jgi:hypothetical protein